MKETPSRLKALQETIMRMNEKNVRLTAENKGLKEDLDKFMEDKARAKDKHSMTSFFYNTLLNIMPYDMYTGVYDNDQIRLFHMQLNHAVNSN